jgi:hypothetical protein
MAARLNQMLNEARPWKPRQIKPKSIRTLVRGPHGLSFSPECAQQIGNCIACWSGIEFYLSETFSYLIDANDGWTVSNLFRDIRDLRTKKKTFEDTVRKKLGARWAKSVKELLGPLQELKAERDLLAHSFFLVVDDVEKSIIRVEGWGVEEQWWFYELNTLKALWGELEKHGKKLQELSFEIVLVTPTKHEPGRWMVPGRPW